MHDNNTGERLHKTKFVKSIRDLKRITLLDEDTFLYGVSTRGNSRELGHILFARTYGDKHLVILNSCKAVGKEFYRIQVQELEKEKLALLLNSTFAILQRELLGITNLGGGAIKFSIDEVKNS